MKAARPYKPTSLVMHVWRLIGCALLALFFASATVRADWRANGSAYLSGGSMIVTPASGNQVGSVWIDTRIDLMRDFDLTLSLYPGTNDNGADGMAVVFQNDPRGLAAVGDSAAGGEWLGLHSISPALAVEIDTYQNSGWGDPSQDHIGIDEITGPADGPDHAGAAPVAVGNVEDGAPHLLRLAWNSAATTLTIYLDGTLRITYTRDIVTRIFGGASQVWFGVVGSTGGAYNLQQFQPLMVNARLNVVKAVTPAAVDSGQTVTYTITLTNSGGMPATLSRIEDQLPADFAYLPGTTNGLTLLDPAVAGATLTWSGAWTMAPGQTRTLSFQTLVAAAAGVYANTVLVSGPDCAEITSGPTAQVVVSSGPAPISGTKPLYLFDTTALSRIVPSTSSAVNINGSNTSRAWVLNPALAQPLVIDHADGQIPVYLWIANNSTRWIRISLTSSGGIPIGTLSFAAVPASSGSPVLRHFQIPMAGNPITLPAGDQIRLQVTNLSGSNLSVSTLAGGQPSRVVLQADTVIQVSLVAFYSAAYPAGAPISAAAPGQDIYIRAVVSDPFGSFDISSVALDFRDPAGLPVSVGPDMAQVYDSGAAQKIYEVRYSLPLDAVSGAWTARVTAEEGSEGLVRHTRSAILQLTAPAVVLFKTVATETDPINGGLYPKAIPGADMRYTVTATNQGEGAADPDSVIIVDPLPPHTAFFVGDLGAPGSGPVSFSDGAIPSGLSYHFAGLGDPGDDLAFSNNNGVSWGYVPLPDADGFNSSVTHVRINPKGIFNAAADAHVPAFTLQFRVRVR